MIPTDKRFPLNIGDISLIPITSEIDYCFDSTSMNISSKLMAGNIDVEETLKRLLENQKEKDVIIKCDWCGQWGAVKTQCRYCGKAVG